MSVETAIQEIPEEFIKVVKDFIRDIQTTFPEYTPLIQKWWKDDDERSVEILFEFCQRKIPPRFFDILYQNESIFAEDSDLDTEFLPSIHFKNLWSCDITKTTRETIWKYLQLIMFSIIGTIHNKESFGDTAKLFENIDQEEFKSKLEETISHIQNLVELSAQAQRGEGEGEGDQGDQEDKQKQPESGPNIPNAEEIHSHITGMLEGKLGKLAREIAEETASSLNMDFDGDTDMKDIFQKLVSNPGQMMGLVKSVGDKLDTKLKSGDLKETELITEATNIMNQMKNMPGMDNIQSMLHKFGMSGMAGDLAGMNGKVNVGAMEAQLNNRMKIAKTKERIKAKAEANARAKILQQALNATAATATTTTTTTATREEQVKPAFSDEELMKLFDSVEKAQKTPRKKTGKK